MVDRTHGSQHIDLRIREHLSDVVDRSRRYARLSQTLEPLLLRGSR
jgi:hypothetical protein